MARCSRAEAREIARRWEEDTSDVALFRATLGQTALSNPSVTLHPLKAGGFLAVIWRGNKSRSAERDVAVCIAGGAKCRSVSTEGAIVDAVKLLYEIYPTQPRRLSRSGKERA